MMTVPFGNNIKLYLYGSSHGEKIGLLLKGFPGGVPVSAERMKKLLARRAPGGELSSARREPDEPVFVSGFTEELVTDGTDICIEIFNRDARSGDYSEVNFIPRPSHADYAAVMKYGHDADLRGGGIFSGRMTAMLCAAGALCADYLRAFHIESTAHIYAIHDIKDTPFDAVNVGRQEKKRLEEADFPVLDAAAGEKMKAAIRAAKEDGNSVGGIIECAVTGLPAGLGEHPFASVEERISSALFAIPGVKGVAFGAGFGAASLTGSENNDCFTVSDGKVRTSTNNNGGVTGGMTNGMPVVFRAAIKPTPSIAKAQTSVDLRTMTETELKITGRHDPCIVPRAVPVAEAAAAIAIADILIGERRAAENTLETLRAQINAEDEILADVFRRRMETAAKIGEYKKQHGIPVNDPAREQKVLEKVCAGAGGYAEETRELYETIFRLSKRKQEALSDGNK